MAKNTVEETKMEVVEEVQEVVEEAEEVVENPYNLRPLVASDMGGICKIISAIGIRQFKESFNVEGLDMQNLKIEQVGMTIGIDIAGIIVSNYPKAENEVQTFLASLTGKKIAEIQKMGFADFGELIMTVVMKEEFQDFFKRVMKLFNR